MKTLLVKVPDLVEQRRIEEILASQNRTSSASETELAKLRSQKTGLMQDLLTGKVRVTPLLETVGPIEIYEDI